MEHRIKNLFLFSIFFLALGFFPKPLEGKFVFLTDFDDTLVRKGGAWRTYFEIFLIESIYNTLQVDLLKDQPKTILVSGEEFDDVLPLLGKGSGQMGSLKPFSLSQDPHLKKRPKTIIPGYYQAVKPVTFKYFLPSSVEGESFLVRDYQRAHKLSLKTHETWQGSAFPILESLFSQLQPVPVEVAISTARGQGLEEFQSLFHEMHKDKFLKNSSLKYFLNGQEHVSDLRVYALNRPSSVVLGKTDSEKKKSICFKRSNSVGFFKAWPFFRSAFTSSPSSKRRNKKTHAHFIYCGRCPREH